MKSLETKKTVRVNTKKNYINHLLVNVQSHFVRYSSRYSFLLNLLGKAVFNLDGITIDIPNVDNDDMSSMTFDTAFGTDPNMKGTSINIDNNRNTDGVSTITSHNSISNIANSLYLPENVSNISHNKTYYPGFDQSNSSNLFVNEQIRSIVILNNIPVDDYHSDISSNSSSCDNSIKENIRKRSTFKSLTKDYIPPAGKIEILEPLAIRK